MVAKGFRLGMLLQLSIGPVFMLVFHAAGTSGFLSGLAVVLAATMVDLFYMSVAGTGVVSLLKKTKIFRIFKIFGFGVLFIFGIHTITNALHHPLLPEINLFSSINSRSYFLQGILVTASNPLTILFWSGVYSLEAAKQNFNKKQLISFATGCVLATILFLTTVSATGSLFNIFFSPLIITCLNIIVGIILILLSFQFLFKKKAAYLCDAK